MPRPIASSSSPSESLDSVSGIRGSAPDPGPMPVPPLYEIDLSLPPSERWTQIVRDYKLPLQQASHLYASILDQSGWPKVTGFLATAFLRKVYDKEEQEEVQGIVRESGMRMCEVVAYNTFLDLFSGCASGGVRAHMPLPTPSAALDTTGTATGSSRRKTTGKRAQLKSRAREATRSTMLHFRNLDWGMDVLRDLLIRVDYVRHGKVVARVVTYAGYVGVLTGVRQGLSMSLNYRPRLSAHLSTTARNLSTAKHYVHYLLVLLGARPSTPSLLRTLLLSPGVCPSLDEITERFKVKKSGPCYLTFCSRNEVLIIEKGLDGIECGLSGNAVPGCSTSCEQVGKRYGVGHAMKLRPRKRAQKSDSGRRGPKDSTAVLPSSVTGGGIQRDQCFAAVTNHDQEAECLSRDQWESVLEETVAPDLDVGGVEWIVKDSLERKRRIVDMWEAGRIRIRRSMNTTRKNGGSEVERSSVDIEEVKKWLRTYPVRNECTHFSCIMDPSHDGGGLLCVE